MADELKTSLGFEATEAINVLQRIQAELDAYTAAMRSAGAGTAAFNTSGGKFDKVAASLAASLNDLASAADRAATKLNEVASANRAVSAVARAAQGSLEARAVELRAAQRQAEGIMDVQRARELGTRAAELERQASLKATLQKAQETRALEAAAKARIDPKGLMPATGQAAIEKTVRDIKAANAEVSAFAKNVETAGKKGSEAGRAVLLSWQSVVRIFAIQLIHRAITQLSDAFVDGMRQAIDYQTALAEIQTIGDDLGLSMQQLDERVVAVSKAFGQPLDVVAEGLYQTLSNQIAEGSQNFEFLATSSKFAVAAVTDTASSVNLLSSALKSYGMSSTETEAVAGKLFRLIDLGRVRADEMANSFGRVAVLAKQAGVSFDELLASIAELTISGLRYNEAYTLVNNTILKLLKPTEELKRVFDRMGISSGEAGIQAFGFQGFLQKLATQSGDTATDIGKMFNQIRAIRGVLGLTGSAAEKFNDTLAEIKQSSDIDLQTAFSTIFLTDANKIKREMAEIQALFISGFGQEALKAVNAVFDAFGGGAATIKTFGVVFAAAAGAYILSSTGIISATYAMTLSMEAFVGGIATAQAALIGFAATPLGAALIIGGLILGASAAFNLFEDSTRKAAEAVIAGNNAQLRSTILTETARREELKKSETEILANMQKRLFALQAKWTQDAKFALSFQQTFLKSIGQQVEERVSLSEDFVKRLNEVAIDANNALKDLDTKIKSAALSLEGFQFERQIKGLDEGRQVVAQIQRSQELAARSAREAAIGNKESASELLKEAEALAKAALSTADTAKNRSLELRAAQQVQSILTQNVQAIEAEKRQQLAFAKAAREQVPDAESLLFQLKAIVTALEDMELIQKGLKFDPELKPADAKNKATAYAQAIQDILAKLGTRIQLFEKYDPDFGPLLRKVREKFSNPLTGQKLDLTNIFDYNFGFILDTLKKQAESLPADQKILLSTLFNIDLGDPAFISKVQAELTKIPDIIQKGAKATLDLKTNLVDQKKVTSEIEVLTNRVMVSARDITLRPFAQEATGVRGTIADIAGIISTMRGIIFQPETLRQNAEAVNNFTAIVTRDVKDVEKALQTNEPANAARKIEELQRVAQATRPAFPQLATQIDELVKKLIELRDQAKAAATLKDAAETLTPMEQKVKSLGDAEKKANEEALKAGTSAQTGYNQAGNASSIFQDQISAEIRLLQERNQLLAGGEMATAEEGITARYGGLVFRKDGGVILDPRTFYRALGGPLGTDNQLAMLTRGESVNTVDATRRFFPQIQAMNAGVAPVFRQDGGITTTVGDVHINVTESTGPRETAREVVKQFNRELRRHTITLRR